MKTYLNFTILLCCFTLLFSCKEKPAPVLADNGDLSFGEQISTDGAISYDKLYEMMQEQDSVAATVIGNITSVCKVKGCWMHIEGDKYVEEEKLMVKFKDYGFFMPLECEGQEAIMRGMAYREVTSVDELKHYAEDEGLPQEEIDAITEPKTELKFMADGVILKPKA